MNYVNLGRSGLKVSRIALGMMTYGAPQWRPWVIERNLAANALENAHGEMRVRGSHALE